MNKPRTFSTGGIHLDENKLSGSQLVTFVDLPREVTMLMNQHAGNPARPVVEKGDHVKRGDVIANADGLVSAYIHSPISGEVTSVGMVKDAYGKPCEGITIKSDPIDYNIDIEEVHEREAVRTNDDIASLTPDEIVSIVKEAGIVGLGGATFPTHVKLSPPPGFKPEILIINGAECEPYLTNDHALMLAHPDEIIEETRLLRRATHVPRAVIAIESNKPDAIRLLWGKTAGLDDITVMPLKTKYPQGCEKQLIEAVTGRQVPSGSLPVATGAIVQNVATAYAVHRAVRYDEPLMKRIITVTGDSVRFPGNYHCSIGRSLRSIIEQAGGLPDDTAKVILGGPMMGRTVENLDAPSTKGVSCILILDDKQARRREAEPCIRCGACVNACPMGLEPFLISTLARKGRMEDAAHEKIMNCIECGSCNYACPAARPLLDYIRLGKIGIKAVSKDKKKKLIKWKGH